MTQKKSFIFTGSTFDYISRWVVTAFSSGGAVSFVAAIVSIIYQLTQSWGVWGSLLTMGVAVGLVHMILPWMLDLVLWLAAYLIRHLNYNKSFFSFDFDRERLYRDVRGSLCRFWILVIAVVLGASLLYPDLVKEWHFSFPSLEYVPIFWQGMSLPLGRLVVEAIDIIKVLEGFSTYSFIALSFLGFIMGRMLVSCVSLSINQHIIRAYIIGGLSYKDQKDFSWDGTLSQSIYYFGWYEFLDKITLGLLHPWLYGHAMSYFLENIRYQGTRVRFQRDIKDLYRLYAIYFTGPYLMLLGLGWYIITSHGSNEWLIDLLLQKSSMPTWEQMMAHKIYTVMWFLWCVVANTLAQTIFRTHRYRWTINRCSVPGHYRCYVSLSLPKVFLYTMIPFLGPLYLRYFIESHHLLPWVMDENQQEDAAVDKSL